MIEVYRSGDYFEAQLLLGQLRSHGIQAFLQGDSLQGGLGELPAIGHMAIFVADDDHLAAVNLIAAYENGDLALRDEP